jgi:hypothetical protein
MYASPIEAAWRDEPARLTWRNKDTLVTGPLAVRNDLVRRQNSARIVLAEAPSS